MHKMLTDDLINNKVRKRHCHVEKNTDFFFFLHYFWSSGFSYLNLQDFFRAGELIFFSGKEAAL